MRNPRFAGSEGLKNAQPTCRISDRNLEFLAFDRKLDMLDPASGAFQCKDEGLFRVCLDRLLSPVFRSTSPSPSTQWT